MSQSFIVCRGRGWEKRYFNRFVNQVPYMAQKKELAMIFDHREMAEAVAKKCEEHSGRKYSVIEVGCNDGKNT
jgi:hypothetical protein